MVFPAATVELGGMAKALTSTVVPGRAYAAHATCRRRFCNPYSNLRIDVFDDKPGSLAVAALTNCSSRADLT